MSAALPAGSTFALEQLVAPDVAIARFLERAMLAEVGAEVIALDAAFGRVLAHDVRADRAYPSAPRSTMDGLAVASAGGDAVRRIVGEVRMGTAPTMAIGALDAVHVPTGGVLPDGADAVVPIEDVDPVAFAGEVGAAYALRTPVDAGAYVTQPGEDMQPGDVVLQRGRRIAGPELGVLATLGIVEVAVIRRPRVAIVSTGDELVDPGVQPNRGQVRDSNRYAIAGSLSAIGCEPVHLPRARDEPGALEAALGAALACADAVVISGGSSVGERDLTPHAIDALGAPGVLVHGLRVKPGKPTVFGVVDGKPIVGLPGNPTSALMILEAVALPIFQLLAGTTQSTSSQPAVAAVDFVGRPGWTWYVPAELVPDGDRLRALPLPLRSAHTSLLARAHGYVTVGPEAGRIDAGSTIVVKRFGGGGRIISGQW